MNEKSAIKYRVVFYILMLLTVASLVAAVVMLCCFDPFVSYILFGTAGLLFLTQLLVATFATVFKSKSKVNGFEQWLVSFEVVAVMTLVVAFSPILLIMRLVDFIIQRKLARQKD